MIANRWFLRNQAGFTLVEIMVAITLGLLILGGVVQIFVSNSQAYRVQDDMARVQENGRVAVDLIAQNLRKAGYKNDPAVDDAGAFPAKTGLAAPSANFPVSGQVIGNGTNPGGSMKAGESAVTFRFQQSGDVSIRDCANQLGATVAGTVVENTFYVNTNNQLVCFTSVTNNNITLIDGIERMLVSYGMDSSGDLTADSYVLEANVAAAGGWQNVVSVRVSLLSQSLADNLTDASIAYNWNGASVAVADRRIRRVFTSTVNLRNVTQ